MALAALRIYVMIFIYGTREMTLNANNYGKHNKNTLTTIHAAWNNTNQYRMDAIVVMNGLSLLYFCLVRGGIVDTIAFDMSLLFNSYTAPCRTPYDAIVHLCGWCRFSFKLFFFLFLESTWNCFDSSRHTKNQNGRNECERRDDNLELCYCICKDLCKRRKKSVYRWKMVCSLRCLI